MRRGRAHAHESWATRHISPQSPPFIKGGAGGFVGDFLANNLYPILSPIPLQQQHVKERKSEKRDAEKAVGRKKSGVKSLQTVAVK